MSLDVDGFSSSALGTKVLDTSWLITRKYVFIVKNTTVKGWIIDKFKQVENRKLGASGMKGSVIFFYKNIWVHDGSMWYWNCISWGVVIWRGRQLWPTIALLIIVRLHPNFLVLCSLPISAKLRGSMMNLRGVWSKFSKFNNILLLT